MNILALVLVLAAAAHAGKVHPSLKARLAKGEVLDVIIQLPSVDDIFSSPAVVHKASQAEGTATMISMLKERTANSRRPFVNILNELGLGNQRSISNPIWISNRFEVKKVDAALAEVLARVPGDFVIREPKTATIIEPVQTRPVDINEVKQNPNQWGVDMVEAPRAWNTTRGAGVVVGIIDTGVYLEHPALQEAYAGAWHDPYYATAGPTDQQSHGTHCIGSTLGRANGIGVAPEARWTACRGLNHQGSGTEAALLECAQWMLTATPKANVITNSWGGGSNDDWYNDAMRAWQQNGQIPVFAMGNSGSSCRSANSPGDSIYTIGVAATTISDGLATFSSRGPAATGAYKPEVSAPGENIISAGNTGSTYTSKSGTSMATPHVAGVVALMLSVDPTMRYAAVKNILQTTGDRPGVPTSIIQCSTTGEEWPNHGFGHGRSNAASAVEAALASRGEYYF